MRTKRRETFLQQLGCSDLLDFAWKLAQLIIVMFAGYVLVCALLACGQGPAWRLP